MVLASVSARSSSMTRILWADGRMALMELRMLVAALVMKYKWTGVPDKRERWDEDMVPVDTSVLHPRAGKCVLKLELRK